MSASISAIKLSSLGLAISAKGNTFSAVLVSEQMVNVRKNGMTTTIEQSQIQKPSPMIIAGIGSFARISNRTVELTRRRGFIQPSPNQRVSTGSGSDRLCFHAPAARFARLVGHQPRMRTL